MAAAEAVVADAGVDAAEVMAVVADAGIGGRVAATSRERASGLRANVN